MAVLLNENVCTHNGQAARTMAGKRPSSKRTFTTMSSKRTSTRSNVSRTLRQPQRRYRVNPWHKVHALRGAVQYNRQNSWHRMQNPANVGVVRRRHAKETGHTRAVARQEPSVAGLVRSGAGQAGNGNTDKQNQTRSRRRTSTIQQQ